MVESVIFAVINENNITRIVLFTFQVTITNILLKYVFMISMLFITIIDTVYINISKYKKLKTNLMKPGKILLTHDMMTWEHSA